MKAKKSIVFIMTSIFVLSFAGSVFAAETNYKIKKLADKLYKKRTVMNAQRQLVTYGHEATEYLIPVLQDDNNSSAQIAALRVLYQTGDPQAEDAVVELLSSRDNRVRQDAARTLSVIAEKSSTIEPLKALLRDPFPNVRFNAVRALSKLSPPDEEQLFIAALNDYDPRVRMFAVKALGNIRSTAAVPVMAQMVGDPDPSVRMELVKTLGKIDTAGCLQPLAWLTRDPETAIRISAVTAISDLKNGDVDRVLVESASSVDPRVASVAIIGLGKRNSPMALEVAKEHINDEHLDIRLAAIETIGNTGGAKEKKMLEPLLKAESTNVREEAAMAIGKIDSNL